MTFCRILQSWLEIAKYNLWVCKESYLNWIFEVGGNLASKRINEFDLHLVPGCKATFVSHVKVSKELFRFIWDALTAAAAL